MGGTTHGAGWTCHPTPDPHRWPEALPEDDPRLATTDAEQEALVVTLLAALHEQIPVPPG